MLNQTNQFLPIPGVIAGSRFQTIGISELNTAGNPAREYIFTNPDGTGDERRQRGSRAGARDWCWTGEPDVRQRERVQRSRRYGESAAQRALLSTTIPRRRSRRWPRHYALFFSIITDPDGLGPLPPLVVLTPQDQADIVAYTKLLE